jgi:hypothetical protein
MSTLKTSAATKQASAWKRIAVISFFAGAGFAVVGLAMLAGIGWYTSRPKPLKQCDTKAIVAMEDAPGFGVSDDGKR